MKVFGVVGWKDSGKTTLTVRLVEDLTARGLFVATLKHSHSSRQMDVEGTDTFRHTKAGARMVTLVGDDGWAQVRQGPPLETADLPSLCEGADIVIAEGFKKSPWPKIACIANGDLTIRDASENVLAIACADKIPESELPTFSRDEVSAIADFILAQ